METKAAAVAAQASSNVEVKVSKGTVSLNVSASKEGAGAVSLNVSVPLIEILQKAADKTAGSLDNQAVALLQLILSQYEAAKGKA